MSALGYHLILKLVDGPVIATSTAERRVLARTVLHICSTSRLLAFRGVDSHLHLDLASDRTEAGGVARRVAGAVRRRLRLPVPFQPTWFEPIETQRHGYNVFRYTFDQEARHGLDIDPLFEASNLPDLLGLRLLGGYAIRHVRALLPRIDAKELWDRLTRAAHPAPASPVELLVDAAAAAVALPDLGGRRAEVVQARLAAIHAGRDQFSNAEIASALGISVRQVQRLQLRSPSAPLVEAVRRQVVVRQAAAQRFEARRQDEARGLELGAVDAAVGRNAHRQPARAPVQAA